MAHLFRSVFLRAGLDYHDCGQTAALKDGRRVREACLSLEQTGADRHCQGSPQPEMLT
jgi:hypothetical protein